MESRNKFYASLNGLFQSMWIILCGFLLMIHGTVLAQEGNPAYESQPWIHTGGPIGGLGYDIRYNFDNPDIWYVTDNKAGFHMSTDNGLTWFTSNEGISIGAVSGEHLPVFCATVDPIHPNIVWIGTQYSGKIFKSTDYGYTWTEKTNGTEQDVTGGISFRGFTVDPTTSDVVYAMAEVSSWVWTGDESRVTGMGGDVVKGIVFKTTNGGELWEQIWFGDNLCRYCWIDPQNTDVLYVSTGIFDRDAGNLDIQAKDPGGVGVLKSIDGGTTWNILDQNNGLMNLFIGSLYMHPTNPDILLAGTGSDYIGDLVDDQFAGVYLTEDGGANWTRVLRDETFGAVEYYDPDPNIAYAISNRAVYRSEDGGHNWQRFNRPDETWGPPGIIAGMPIDAQCDPRDPNRIFVNNYLGGNFLSEDGGRTWILASKGYTGAEVLDLAIVPDQSAKVYCGARSGVFRSDNGGNDWYGLAYSSETFSAIEFNEITAIAVDPTNGNHVLTACNQKKGVIISKDGGQSWTTVFLLNNPFVLAYAPSNPDIVYASTLPLNVRDDIMHDGVCEGVEFDLDWIHLYVSTDKGDTWTMLENPDEGYALFTLAVHPRDPNTLIASRPDADLVKSTDGGKSWTSIHTDLPLTIAMSLAFDPNNPDVVFAGFHNAGLYRSLDGGNSWTQMTAGLTPEDVVTSIVFDPTDNDVVYIGTGFSGVYYSTNGGEIWQPLTDGMTHKMVSTLAISDDGTVLYAGITGNGVNRLGEVKSTSVKEKTDLPSAPFVLEQNYPNPFNPETNIRYHVPNSSQVILTVYDVLGQKVVELVNSLIKGGSHTVTWNGRNDRGEAMPSGVYICQIKAGTFIRSRKLILNR